jgi:protein gp37
MAETTKIEWTDATVNFWWGCTKVGPGCDHCYAEAWAERFDEVLWGQGVARRKVKSAMPTLAKLHNGAERFQAKHGRRRRVFLQSMSDLFDKEVPDEWLAEAWTGITMANRLELQIVTKRVSFVERRLDGRTWPQHAGLIISVVNQEEADRDIPRLLEVKARLGIPWVGLSMEPLLGRVVLKPEWLALLDWVIVGGESGGHARPMHPDWARDLRDQCATAGVPFLFKQWGEWAPIIDRERDDSNEFADRGNVKWLNLAGGCGFHGERFHVMRRIGKKATGRLLDGVEHNGFPQVPA